MNADTILTSTLALVTPNIHKTRKISIHACIRSLMHGADGTVTSIGRGIKSEAYEKHNIKRADRLLSNVHLWHELPQIYTALSLHLCKFTPNPIIHIDWSDLDTYKRHFLIRASVVFSGRALTLYQEVHDIRSKEKPKTHEQFLLRLKRMLGDETKSVIVTDAGFKSPWFRQVIAQGWDYVGRVRKPHHYQTQTQDWQCISTLYGQATRTPSVLQATISRHNPLDTTLVLLKEKPKGRKALNRSGIPYQSLRSKTYARRAKDPWLLATSLPVTSKLGKKICSIYRTRMQIEEGFRDMKSQQFGLGFGNNRTVKLPRLAVLVFLLSLAHLVLVLIGLAVCATGTHRQYQANTYRKRRVLSFHSLGIRAVRRGRFRITMSQWHDTMIQFRKYIRALEYERI